MTMMARPRRPLLAGRSRRSLVRIGEMMDHDRLRRARPAPELLTALTASATRSRRRSSATPSRRCSPGATCSARRPPAPARRRRSPCRPSQLIDRRRPAPSPVALVLVPTRELAVQVSEAMYRYGRELGARVVPIYGGQPIGRQLGALRDGVHVVVATPGRAIDHINRGTLRARRRADRRARRGRRDARHGLRRGHRGDPRRDAGDRQTVLFSATMPPRIDAHRPARTMRDPVRIQIERAADRPRGRPARRPSAPTS